MPRHRIRRQTMGKDPIKKATTLLDNIGQGSGSVYAHNLIVTGAGSRSTTGATQTIRDTASTADVCNVGDIVKYVNICVQVGNRSLEMQENDDDNGWVEYAIVKHKEVAQNPATTNLGVQTLQDVCTKAFRGDCIWTGCIPIGSQQPNSLDIKLKLPKIFTKMQIGSTLTFYAHFRSVNSTDLRSDSLRIVTTAQYKVYV